MTPGISSIISLALSDTDNSRTFSPELEVVGGAGELPYKIGGGYVHASRIQRLVCVSEDSCSALLLLGDVISVVQPDTRGEEHVWILCDDQHFSYLSQVEWVKSWRPELVQQLQFEQSDRSNFWYWYLYVSVWRPDRMSSETFTWATTADDEEKIYGTIHLQFWKIVFELLLNSGVRCRSTVWLSVSMTDSEE